MLCFDQRAINCKMIGPAAKKNFAWVSCAWTATSLTNQIIMIHEHSFNTVFANSLWRTRWVIPIHLFIPVIKTHDFFCLLNYWTKFCAYMFLCWRTCKRLLTYTNFLYNCEDKDIFSYSLYALGCWLCIFWLFIMHWLQASTRAYHWIFHLFLLLLDLGKLAFDLFKVEMLSVWLIVRRRKNSYPTVCLQHWSRLLIDIMSQCLKTLMLSAG